MLVGVFHFLAVIPGRAQREPGIQRRLPNSCLDPGSALRAVRDDVKKSGVPAGGRFAFDVIPGPPQAEPGIQRLGSNGLFRALSTWAAQALAGCLSGSRLGATRRPG